MNSLWIRPAGTLFFQRRVCVCFDDESGLLDSSAEFERGQGRCVLCGMHVIEGDCLIHVQRLNGFRDAASYLVCGKLCAFA